MKPNNAPESTGAPAPVDPLTCSNSASMQKNKTKKQSD